MMKFVIGFVPLGTAHLYAFTWRVIQDLFDTSRTVVALDSPDDALLKSLPTAAEAPFSVRAVPHSLVLAGKLVEAEVVRAKSTLQHGCAGIFACKPFPKGSIVFSVEAVGGWCKLVKDAQESLAAVLAHKAWDCAVDLSGCKVLQCGKWFTAALQEVSLWPSLQFIDPCSQHAGTVSNCAALRRTRESARVSV